MPATGVSRQQFRRDGGSRACWTRPYAVTLMTMGVLLLIFTAYINVSFHTAKYNSKPQHLVEEQQVQETAPKARVAAPTWASSYAAADLADTVQLDYPIWWAAPFKSVSGYGNEAVSYTLGLVERGLVRPQDIYISQSGDGIDQGWHHRVPRHVASFIEKQDYTHLKEVLSDEEKNRRIIAVCHSFPDCWRSSRESSYPPLPGTPCPTNEMQPLLQYKIGRTMFETDGLPDHLRDHVTQFDEIWVPSEFNRETFARAGVPKERIYVLPQGINTTDFNPERVTRKLTVRDAEGVLVTGAPPSKDSPTKFVFLSIFKWEARKGWDVLFKAFLEEFKGDEGVELHIATHPFMEVVASWKEKARRAIMLQAASALPKRHMTDRDWEVLPRIYITSAHIPDADFPALYNGADALVIPTRGEGWGRPQMEAMAMGLPVISTNWSGVTEFLDETTGFPIPIEGLVRASSLNDGGSFFAYFNGQSWAQPSQSELQKLMRQVVSDPKAARERAQNGLKRVQTEFSPQAIAQKAHQLIMDVQKRAAAKRRL